MPNAGKMNVQINFQADKANLSSIQTDLSKIIALSKQPGQKMNEELQVAANTAQKLQSVLNNSFNKDLGTVNVKKFNQELTKSGLTASQIKTALSSIGAEGAASFNKLSTMVVSTNVKLKESNKLLDSMAKTMTNTVKWGVSAAIFDTAAKSIKSAYDYSVDLNKSLNDIRIVTGQSSEQMAKFAEEANTAAKQLGANTLDYTNAALIYYQQGLSDEEAKRRAEITTKVVNVTGQSGAQASEELTAIWNGYKVTAKEAEEYIDKVAKVAAVSAADLEELATGMSKVASAANNAGVDVDQLNALLATVISTTREAPETIGSSFKTIFARLGDLKLNGQDEFGVSLGKVSSQMEALGIQILDEQGEMRNMGDIIEDTAKKWDTWTQAQKQAASIAMAGKMQYSRLIALFDGWDQYERYLTNSKDALGELNKQQSIYLDSTNAKLNRLKSTWQDLYAGLIDDDELGKGIDTIRNLVQVIDNFFDSFGGGMKSIAAFGALFSNIFSQQISQALVKAKKEQDIYQENIDIVKNKIDYLNQGVVESQQGASPQQLAEQANLEKQLEIANKIKEVKNGITAEDYKYLTTQQNIIGSLEQERVLKLEEAKAAAISKGLDEKKLIDVIKYTEELGKQEQELDSLNNLIEKISNDEENLSVSRKKQKDFLKEIQQTIEEINVLEEKGLVTETQKNKIYEQEDKLENLIKQTLDKKKITSEDIKKIQEETVKYIKKLNAPDKDLYNKQMALTEYNMSYEETLKAEEQEKLMLNEINTILENRKKVSLTYEDVTKITTALSSVVIGWSSVNSVIQTINDTSLSFEDKITQIVMTGTTGITMLIGGFKKLNEVMGYTTTISEAVAAKKAIINIESSYGIKLSNAEAIASFKEGLMSKALAVAKEQEVIAREKNIADLSKEEIAKILSLEVNKQEAATILAVENAQKKLNATMLANPLMKILLIVTALTAAYSAYKKIQEENLETQIKANKQQIENNDKKLEKIQALKDEVKQYESLYEQYKETNKANEEFLNTTKDLITQLDIENGWLLLQQEKYEELAIAIENAKNKKQEFSTTEIAESSADAALDNLQKSFVKTSKNIVIEQTGENGITNLLNGYGIDSWVTFKGHALGQGGYASQKLKDLIYQNISSEFISDTGNLGIKSQDVDNPEKVEKFTLQVIKLRDELYKSYKDLSNEDKSFYGIINKWISENQEAIDNYQTYTDVLLNSKIEDKIQKIGFNEEDIKGLDTFSKKYKELFNFIAEQKGYDLTNLTEEQIDEVAKLTQKQIRAISDAADAAMTKKLSVDELTDQGWSKELAEKYVDVLSQKTQSSNRVESIGEILEALKQEKELTDKQDALIKKLNQDYKQLAEIKNESSHEYLETLRNIQEQEEDNKKQAIIQEQEILELRKQGQEETIKNLEEQYEKAKDDAEKAEIFIKIKAETEELNKTIDEIINADYSLKLEIDADLASDVDQAFGLADEIADLQDLVSDSLQITFDQAQDLIAKGYGEILQNAEPTADSLIKLNQDVYNSYIDGKQKELNADRLEKIEQLQNQRKLLEAQQQALQAKLKYLQQGLEASSATDAAEALSNAQKEDEKYHQSVDALNETLKAKSEGASETENINEQLFNDLGGFYEKNSINQQQAESDATTQQAKEIQKRLSNIRQEFNAQQALANQIRAAQSGGTVAWGVNEGGLQFGGGIQTTGSKQVEAKPISASPITSENLEKFFVDNKPTEEYTKTVQSMINQTQNQIDAIEAQKGSIDAGIAALETANASLDKFQSEAGSGSGKKRWWRWRLR